MLEEIRNKEGLKFHNPVNILDLKSAQKENNFIIPSDYIYLLLSTDAISFDSPYQISLDKKNPIEYLLINSFNIYISRDFIPLQTNKLPSISLLPNMQSIHINPSIRR